MRRGNQIDWPGRPPATLAAWHVPADAPFVVDRAGRVRWKSPQAEAEATELDRLLADGFGGPDPDRCFYCGFERDADGCENFDCPGTGVP